MPTPLDEGEGLFMGMFYYYQGPHNVTIPVSREGTDGKFQNVSQYCIKFRATFTEPVSIELIAVVKFRHVYKETDQNIVVCCKFILKNRTSKATQDIIKEGENIISRKDHYSIIPALGHIIAPPGLYKVQLLVSSGASNLPTNTVTAEMLGQHTMMRVSVKTPINVILGG